MSDDPLVHRKTKTEVGHTYRNKSSWKIYESQESYYPNRQSISLHTCRQLLHFLCCLVLKMLKDLSDY